MTPHKPQGIKPSNILVSLDDTVPVPKVIDFGIAKATEGRLSDATIYTNLHQLIGTPAYMSPERADMSGLDIDTRSDIYSLGVLLYELLTGATPVARDALAMRRKLLRDEHPDVAHTLHYLGFYVRGQGKVREAESTVREALVMRKKLLGDQHEAVAQSLHWLAWNLHLLGKHTEAEALSRQEVATRRNLLGHDHPNVAWALGDLTLFLRARENWRRRKRPFANLCRSE